MLAEKELQGCQQRNQTNIDDNLNQILARVEQAFAKVETVIRSQVAASTPKTASSPPPPPPTHTLESDKTLNHDEIIQTNGDRAANGKKEFDVKSENKQVSELKGSFMLATKSDIVEISDDVLNLSTTHAIIEQHLVDTKSELFLSQNNCSNNASDKEELCDNAFIIHMPQLVNEHGTFVLKPNTCIENKHLLPIATERDELKVLSSSYTLGYIEFDTLCALSSLEEKFKCVELPWLSRCTYQLIGKYNCNGEYMVH